MQPARGMEVRRAAAIMMDPNTGEVLAMASNRRYDLNNPYDVWQMDFIRKKMQQIFQKKTG